MGYVDRSVLKQMCADVGEDMLETLISYFVEDATEKIASFKVKLENRDYKALGVLAHTMKSVCAQYGITQCSAHAKELEALCHSQDPSASAEDIATRVTALCSELEGAMEEIRTVTL
ncbi:MAG: Hpt domain-containing protein [Succinivibrionaceae bacterium]|nr:Hpt domain-containing protein [Succinivibrionaceae bacterium]